MAKETYFEQFAPKTLTNSSITIDGSEGYKYVTVQAKGDNTADAVITSSFTGTIGGLAIDQITLSAGDAFTFGTGENSVHGITITAPSGCTVSIAGVKIANPIGS